ncbi:hypothetical protein J2Z69_002751 [Paenibacillus shirakamiensis]|uniref:DUF3784 domain-containing protein n=1 Tax=Paenibacillus shirakamiensis TaxID=1265935 RepID=A0ABS4JKV1_9BACL|nr:hypothetical protein [Paenibacillus shirakamiensis]MBP2001706.1 hypothetical protein [Paenibacillus shirakamiensis]
MFLSLGLWLFMFLTGYSILSRKLLPLFPLFRKGSLPDDLMLAITKYLGCYCLVIAGSGLLWELAHLISPSHSIRVYANVIMMLIVLTASLMMFNKLRGVRVNST